MDVNDNACFLMGRVSFKTIASKLAPTWRHGFCDNEQ
ncbi:hypothetical protein PS914_04924 [Pseudomonas fluorescens]|nr:hypothetical protein PS914_04924 [Pseudomonas fluorescens]